MGPRIHGDTQHHVEPELKPVVRDRPGAHRDDGGMSLGPEHQGRRCPGGDPSGYGGHHVRQDEGPEGDEHDFGDGHRRLGNGAVAGARRTQSVFPA